MANLSDARLSSIHLQLHQAHSGAETFFQMISALFAPLEGVVVEPERVLFQPQAEGAQPLLSLELGESYFPTVLFDLPDSIGLQVGYLHLKSPSGRLEPVLVNQTFPRDLYPMAVEDLSRRFARHLTRLDHAGVELPAGMVSPAEWQQLIASLARSSALYRDPSSDAWRFILPTSNEECQADIDDFSTRRTPMFELVYDEMPVPLFQFHLDTNLPQADVEALTPRPYGFSLPGAKTFRSVYLKHPYRGLRMRVDLTFSPHTHLSDWSSGRYLVEKGGRVRA